MPGGPLQQYCARARTIRALADPVHRGIAALIVVTWVPLAILTLVTGLMPGNVTVPFLKDLDAHLRLLVVMPLLVGAEHVVDEHIRTIVRQFRIRGLIPPQDRLRMDAFIASNMRLKKSVTIEVLMLVLAFVVGYWLWHHSIALHVSTWYAIPDVGRIHLTLPGMWYVFLCLPLFRFLLLRWYFRLALWYRFLWQVSSIRLLLSPLHPDRAGGLSFLSGSTIAFAPLPLAHTVLMSAIIGNRIWHEGAILPQFKVEIAAILAVLVAMVFLPLAFFTPQLAKARREGTREYGAFASRYVREFQDKWRQSGDSKGESPLGSGDIQSLADMGNSFDVVREMGALPVGRKTVMMFVVLIVLPLAPLALTMVPLNQIVEKALMLMV